MKSLLSLFSFLCIVVVSSAILPVEPQPEIAVDPPPLIVDPPPIIVDPPPPVEPCKLILLRSKLETSKHFFERIPNLSGSTDVCSLPSVTGPCKAAIKKYFFNKATGSCEIFTYGGCGGNGNNFDTKEQCLAKCQPGKLTVRMAIPTKIYIAHFFK